MRADADVRDILQSRPNSIEIRLSYYYLALTNIPGSTERRGGPKPSIKKKKQ